MKKVIAFFACFWNNFFPCTIEDMEGKTFIRNIYGDEINHVGGCRSIWKDEFGFRYYCKELKK